METTTQAAYAHRNLPAGIAFDFLAGARLAPVPADVRPAAPATDPITAIARAILDYIQYGAVAVDASGRVSFANRAAMHECRRTNSLLRIDGGRLAATQGSDNRRLAAAIDAARAGRWTMLRIGVDPAALSIAVLPLSARTDDGEPLVLLMFGLRLGAESVGLLLYARACRLTPAETRVLRGLAEGLAPQQIADREQVLLSTVRSHVRNVREKTGTRSITDLVHALIGLPAIMPAVVG